ncbi:hypothetical protein [Vibrio phage vB_ValS_PJ32]|nr:hypothetical protein [Vibrio phage vB_ValS_PJ32]
MPKQSKDLVTEDEFSREERKREQSRKWYEENKKDHNGKRRERYETDPEYREKVRKQARESARKKREATPSVTGIYHRELNGVSVRVFKASEVAEAAGTTVRVLKADEKAGRVPKMLFEGRHRVYTQEQKTSLIEYYAGRITSEELAANWS